MRVKEKNLRAYPGARPRDSTNYLQNTRFYRAAPFSRVSARSARYVALVAIARIARDRAKHTPRDRNALFAGKSYYRAIARGDDYRTYNVLRLPSYVVPSARARTTVPRKPPLALPDRLQVLFVRLEERSR